MGPVQKNQSISDLTWTLQSVPAPAWMMENWPCSDTIIAVMRHGIREGKPQVETRLYKHDCELAPGPCSGPSGSAGGSRKVGTGYAM